MDPDGLFPVGAFFRQRQVGTEAPRVRVEPELRAGGAMRTHPHAQPSRLAAGETSPAPRLSRAVCGEHGLSPGAGVLARLARAEPRLLRSPVLGPALPGLGSLCPLRVVWRLLLLPRPLRAGAAARGPSSRARWVVRGCVRGSPPGPLPLGKTTRLGVKDRVLPGGGKQHNGSAKGLWCLRLRRPRFSP